MDKDHTEKLIKNYGADAICPRCERMVLSYEPSAHIGDDLYHLQCALDEQDEIGMDDFTNER